MNIWLCKKDYENQQRLYGKELEIGNFHNYDRNLCIVCRKRANYLIVGIPTFFKVPMILDDTMENIDIKLGGPLI